MHRSFARAKYNVTLLIIGLLPIGCAAATEEEDDGVEIVDEAITSKAPCTQADEARIDSRCKQDSGGTMVYKPKSCVVASVDANGGHQVQGQCQAVNGASAPSGGAGSKTITQNGFTLRYVSKESKVSSVLANNLTRAFFNAITKESAAFNGRTPRTVTLTIDPAYKSAPAAAGGAGITVNASYILANPNDYDVLTHEAMHIVQNYPGGAPGYWVEGLADYARAVYGLNNAAGGWSLPEVDAKQSYKDSYRVTARFLLWLSRHVKASVPTDLDKKLRAGSYTDQFWVSETGKTVDQLWASYTKSPAL